MNNDTLRHYKLSTHLLISNNSSREQARKKKIFPITNTNNPSPTPTPTHACARPANSMCGKLYGRQTPTHTHTRTPPPTDPQTHTLPHAPTHTRTPTPTHVYRCAQQGTSAHQERGVHLLFRIAALPIQTLEGRGGKPKQPSNEEPHVY